MNDTRPTLTPRSTYAKLADEANIRHDRRKRWELKPLDSHTKLEKNRLANLAWQNRWEDATAAHFGS